MDGFNMLIICNKNHIIGQKASILRLYGFFSFFRIEKLLYINFTKQLEMCKIILNNFRL